MNNSDKSDPKVVKQKLARYCAYQERSVLQVRQKLSEFPISSDQSAQLIQELKEEGFVNDQRFAQVFSGSKFRLKKWGRQKIVFALRQHQLGDHTIHKALQEIDENDYLETLQNLITNRKTLIRKKELNPYVANQKIANYMIRKGFEADLVWDILKGDIN